MIRRLVAAVAAVLGLLAGLWLMLAPFALGNQPAGRDWTRSTTVTVVTGGVVALVGLVGFVAATAALLSVARRYGSAAAPSAPGPAPAPAAPEPNPMRYRSGEVPVDASTVVPEPVSDGPTPPAARRVAAAADASTEPDAVSPADLLAAVLPALVADLTAGTEPAVDPAPGVDPEPGVDPVPGGEAATIGRFPRRPSVGVNGHTGPAWSGFLHPGDGHAEASVADAVHGRGRAVQYRSEVRREGA